MQQDAKSNRRDFLAAMTALGVAGLVGGSGGEYVSDSSADALAGGARLGRLNADDFARLVGQTFRAECANGNRLEMKLVQVKSRSSTLARAGGTRSPFSVLFDVHGVESLPHQICLVEHSDLGRFSLFLGAVGQPSSEVHAEAVFG